MKEPTLGHLLLRKLQESNDVSFKLNMALQKRWLDPHSYPWSTLEMNPLRAAMMANGYMLVSTRQSDSKDIYITCLYDETQPLCLDRRIAGYGLTEEFSVCMLAYLLHKRITKPERCRLAPHLAAQIMSVMQPDFPLYMGLVETMEQKTGVVYYHVRHPEVNAQRMTVSVFTDGHMEAYSKPAVGNSTHYRNLSINIYLPVLVTLHGLLPIK